MGDMMSVTPPKKKMSTGCLIALIVAGLFGAAILLHLALFVYFITAKYEIRQETMAPVEESAASEMVSSE